MFETIQAKREPFLVRARQNLTDYREALIALVGICVFEILQLTVPVLTQSDFENVWFRQGRDASMPVEMKIHLTPKRDALTVTVPIAAWCGHSYEIVTLQLDGKLHPVSGGMWDCTGLLTGAPAYSANLTREAVQIQWAAGLNNGETTDTWTLSDGGRTITVSRAGRKATYRKASWFRSIFTAEP